MQLIVGVDWQAFASDTSPKRMETPAIDPEAHSALSPIRLLTARPVYGALASISGVVSSVWGPFAVQTANCERYIDTPAYSPLTLKA
jgi:hypothetical protein